MAASDGPSGRKKARGAKPPPLVPRGMQIVPFPFTDPKPVGWTRFVLFSDTHGRHDNIPAEHRPAADVLLHMGDFTNTGELEQVQSFSSWLGSYPAAEKVVIAGNHDVTFQEDYYKTNFRRYHRWGAFDCEEVRAALTNCTYLEDTSTTLAAGYEIYGSPWQPEFGGWAFNLNRGAECRKAWEKIPPRPDILMTHGPAKGIVDQCSNGFHAGCEELLTAVKQRTIPLHLSGHIHEAYGMESDGRTLFVNASTCTLQYNPDHAPIVLDLAPVAELRAAAADAQVDISATGQVHDQLGSRCQPRGCNVV